MGCAKALRQGTPGISMKGDKHGWGRVSGGQVVETWNEVSPVTWWKYFGISSGPHGAIIGLNKGNVVAMRSLDHSGDAGFCNISRQYTHPRGCWRITVSLSMVIPTHCYRQPFLSRTEGRVDMAP